MPLRPAWTYARSAGLGARAGLAGREPGQQGAQQALLVLAEGAEQLGFGAVARAGYRRLDPPPGVGQLWDARPPVVRIEAADDEPAGFEPVQERGQGGLVQPEVVGQR